MVSPSLKEQKEAFVTGHDGTTPFEIMLVLLSTPIGILLYMKLLPLLPPLFVTTAKHDWKRAVLLEALLVLFPTIITQTTFLHPWGDIIIIIFLITSFILPSPSPSSPHRTTTPPPPKNTQLSYLTSYRSTILLTTTIAILAVDFHTFPRRFAKTETYGYGLMDLGAGSFIASAGTVSRYARTGATNVPEVWKFVKRTLPLLVIGFVRLAGNKGLDYQEHVSEYGVHWNFFFSLGIVGATATAFRCSVPFFLAGCGADCVRAAHKVSPWMILFVYQWSLSRWGVQDYIEVGERRCQGSYREVGWCDFFAANREGVLGCVGYLALYCMSEEIAWYCVWHCDDALWKDGDTVVKVKSVDKSVSIIRAGGGGEGLHRRRKMQGGATQSNAMSGKKSANVAERARTRPMTGERLFQYTVSLWFHHFLLTYVFSIPNSRRSTNAPFIVWTLATNVTILLILYTIHDHVSPEVPPITNALNRNGLVMFLVANLLTGAVNLGINTLEKTEEEGLLVIFGYVCCVGAIAVALDRVLDITIKLG